MNNRKPIHQQLKDAGCSVITLPLSWQNDPKFQNGLIFTVPPNLLKSVFLHSLYNGAYPDKVQHDVELSNCVNPLNDQVGVWKEAILLYPYLRPRTPLHIAAAAAEVLGKTPVQGKHIARVLERRLAVFDNALRGYLGWLSTQHAFLDEHDALLSVHAERIHAHGFPKPMLTAASLPRVSDEEASWGREFKTFFERWRLQTLAAPYLPIPLAPQLPAITAHGQNQFSIPDIYPTQGTGMINEIMEDVLHEHHGSPHLTEWMAFIGKGNTAKNGMPAYGRRFQLQHFWRILTHRYPSELHGKKGVLCNAFADYFNVSEDTIKGDLRLIRKNLGNDWMNRYVEIC